VPVLAACGCGHLELCLFSVDTPLEPAVMAKQPWANFGAQVSKMSPMCFRIEQL
jgi:hypothetical protein